MNSGADNNASQNPETLLDHLSRFSEKTVSAVNDFFEASRMPVPLKDEIFLSVDSGALFFLEDEACVMRFVSARFKPDFAAPIIDPDILQPIGVRNPTGELYIEIMPGVKCGIPVKEYKTMLIRMQPKGIGSSDSALHSNRNGGLLPDGTPVIIDRGAVQRLEDGAASVKIFLGAQDRIFGSLRNAFDAAWPEEAEKPDARLLSAFWEQCRAKKQEGILVAGWNGLTEKECYNIDDITGPARKYQARRAMYKAAP